MLFHGTAERAYRLQPRADADRQAMRLFWSSRSPFARKVMIAAHELGVAAEITTERVVVDAADPNRRVMHFNPLGRIPTLILGDGRVLHDSAVIIEYLNTRFAGRLVPGSGRERWDALTLQALADGVMEADLRLLEERKHLDRTASATPMSRACAPRSPRRWIISSRRRRRKSRWAKWRSAARSPISISAFRTSRGGPGGRALPRGSTSSRRVPQCGPRPLQINIEVASCLLLRSSRRRPARWKSIAAAAGRWSCCCHRSGAARRTSWSSAIC